MSNGALGPVYPWYLRGVVVHGKGRGGSQLGYPTANIDLDEETVEALKLYNNLVLFGYGCLEPEGGTAAPAEGFGPFPFAMSVGYNPQFENKALTAEVHFLQKFAEDFYDQTIRIAVLGSIRTMAAFKSLEELIATIDKDVEDTKQRLGDPACKAHEKEAFVTPTSEIAPEIMAKAPFLRIGEWD